MSLRWYRRPRLVILHPQAPVLEAARALENNAIGAVLVQSKGRLVGIVTDRDLALRVVGEGLDSRSTKIRDVMSRGVVTLEPSDSQADALALMQRLGIRRIPLVENDGIVGMVTLDDLLLDESASVDDLSAVLEAQVGEGGPRASQRTPAAQKRLSRAEATYGRMLNRIQAETGLSSSEQARTATELVASELVSRLTVDEADDLIAQFPSLLQSVLRRLPPGQDTSINRDSMCSMLVQRLDVSPERANTILECIGTLLLDSVSEGEAANVRGQLPDDLRDAFSNSSPA